MTSPKKLEHGYQLFGSTPVLAATRQAAQRPDSTMKKDKVAWGSKVNRTELFGQHAGRYRVTASESDARSCGRTLGRPLFRAPAGGS